MKYISIDIETTGLNPENCQILSFGAIIEDTNNKLSFEKIPKFHAILTHKRIEGEPFALNMNKDLIGLISQYQNAEALDRKVLNEVEGLFVTPDMLVPHLVEFLDKNGFKTFTDVLKITVAGKNFGVFDKLFIEKLPHWKGNFRINQRIIDPSILFTNWNEDDQLPNLTTCKERAKTGGIVTHNAIDDAWDVIKLLRTQY